MISTSDTPSPDLPTPHFHPFARLLIATFGAVVLSILVSVVVATATALAAQLSGQNSGAQIEKFFNENLLLINLFVYPPILLWLWVCRRFLDRRTFVSLGLRASGLINQFCSGILCGFLAVALIFGVLWLSGNLQIHGISLEAESGGWEKSLFVLGGWAAMMLCVGLFEEIVFRGYAFHNLNQWLGARSANVLQAVVFALIHLGNLAAQGHDSPDATLAAFLALPNIFLIGLFFTLCYLKTGSLWFPIAFHAAWNFFMGCVFSLPVSGMPIFKLFDVTVSGSIPLTGGAFGPEASLLLTPILLAMVFVVSRARDSVQAIADLQSLQATGEPPVVEAMHEEFVADDAQPLSEEQRENRFKTRMGARRHDLDEETQRTLQTLNEARRESSPLPDKSSPFGPILVEPEPAVTERVENLSAPSVPVESVPVESVPVESVPVESAPTASVPTTPTKEALPDIASQEAASPETVPVRTSSPQPKVGSEAKPPQNVPTPTAIPPATPPATPKPKKPAPRW